MAVEEQTQHSWTFLLYADYEEHGGQRLTIPNRKVTKLGFWLYKSGSATGDVTFEIRKVSDDSVICSKVWGDAGDLPTEITYEEVEFDTPPTINEEVRIVVAYHSGNVYNAIYVGGEDSDVKANEVLTYTFHGEWSDHSTHDCAYRYTYSVPGASPARQQMATFLIGGKR